MPLIERLKISNVRNIENADLQLNPGFNLFFGKNGAGKTSVLESVSLLSLGRSFRSNKARFIIRSDQDCASVFAEMRSLEGENLASHKLGVAKFRSDKAKVKIDGESAKSASELARLMPVLTVEPNSFQLLEGGPAQRRSMLDWLVFHVKHEFFSAYRDYQRCLKQRNILLRSDRISRFDLKPWNTLLCESAQVLETLREEAAESLSELLRREFVAELDGLPIELRFRSGWPDQEYSKYSEPSVQISKYIDQLDQSFDRDRRLGYTTIGAHRHDLEFRVEGQPAADVLSRGQKKQLIVCMFLALAKLFEEHNKQSPVLLLDDLPSELDKEKLGWLVGFLRRLGAQTLITSIDSASIKDLIITEDVSATWFHVKHGSVIAKTTLE